MRITLLGFAFVVWATVDARPVAAQSDGSVYYVPRPLVVIARRDLTFGTILPGIPSRVLTTNVGGSGLFEIKGAEHEAVRIEFLLPSSLTSDGGDELPLTFGPGDGAAVADGAGGHGVSFDPRQPLIATLGANGILFIQLGGTALPSSGQDAGSYRATIFLSVFDLGS